MPVETTSESTSTEMGTKVLLAKLMMRPIAAEKSSRMPLS
jgi:hypothetical protein